MANELATVEENWLELAGKFKDLPMPFEKTVFLTECHLAGTECIEDELVKTYDVEEGTELVLRRSSEDELTFSGSLPGTWRMPRS